MNVSYNDTVLVNVNSEKLLDVVIDKHLTWKDHIDKTAKRVKTLLANF